MNPSRRNELIVLAVMFLTWGSTFLVSNAQHFLSPYLLKVFNLSSKQIGVLAAAIPVACAFTSLLAAPLADSFGRLKVLLPSVLAFGVFSGLSGLAQSFEQLLLSRVLIGAAAGPSWITICLLTEESSPPERRGRNVGIVLSAAALIGTAIGSILITQVSDHFGWRWGFFVPGVFCSLMAGVVWASIREPGLRPAKKKEGLTRSDYFTILRQRNVWFSCLGAAGLVTWIATFMAFSPLYITQVAQQTVTGAGLVLGASGLGSFVIGIAGPALSDHTGRKAAIIALAAMTAVAPLVLMFHPLYEQLWLLCGIMFVLTGGQALAPLIMVLVPSESVPQRFAATAISFAAASAQVLGAVGAPLAGGWLATKHGYAAPLFLSSAGAILVFVVGLSLKKLPVPATSSGTLNNDLSASVHEADPMR